MWWVCERRGERGVSGASVVNCACQAAVFCKLVISLLLPLWGSCTVGMQSDSKV